MSLRHVPNFVRNSYENRTKVPAWTRSNRLAALDSSCIETTHQTLVEDWGRPKTDTIQYPITFMWSTNRWQPMGDAQTWWCPFGEPQFLSATSMSLDHWITLNVQLALDSWRLQCWCVLLGQTFCMLARWGFHLWELLRWLYCPGLPRSSCQFWRLSFRNLYANCIACHVGNLRGFSPSSAPKKNCLMWFVDLKQGSLEVPLFAMNTWIARNG